MKNAPILLILLLFFLDSFSQENSCGTAIIMEKSLEQNPGLKKVLDEGNEFAKQYARTERTNKSNEKYVIPIVFHIIHQNGSENVSDLLIQRAVKILNDNFQKKHAGVSQIIEAFADIAANTQIEFRLAQIDPNGNCTNGITRTVSGLTNGAGENVKGLINWDTKKYLNIWVARTLFITNLGGFARFPGTVPQNQEGIVLRALEVANTSYLLTHEIGHYLNLRHTWGNSASEGLPSNCNVDDLVEDTPNTIGAAFKCDLDQESCGSLDNVQNYMGYESCRRMFTEGQKTRMHATLNSSIGARNNLWTEANLIATGTNDGFENCITALENVNEQYFSLNIFPNPITKNSVVEINLDKPAQVSIKIMDVLGNIISEKKLGKISDGYKSDVLKNVPNISPGVYFLHVTFNNKPIIRKITI